MSQTFVLQKDGTRDSVMDRLLKLLAGLSITRTWTVEIKQFVKARTNLQNSALFGVAYPAIVKATGQEADDWHTYFLGEWFGWTEYELFGRKKLRPKRTTTTGFNGEPDVLSTTSFAEFYDFIQRRAAENGVSVPDPDPMYFLQGAPP